MMKITKAAAIALAAILAPGAAQDAAAQTQRPIRPSEAAAVQAADVYELVEKLRPEWLWMGGNPQYAASRANVRVWVGDTEVGGLEALRGLPTENLYNVRLVGRRVARARDARLDPEVVAALLVRYESGPPPPRRFEVTAGLGYRSLLEPRARQAMIEAGLDSLGTNALWSRRIRHPITLHAAGAMHLGRGAGVAASVLRTGSHNVRGLPLHPPFEGISDHFSTTDLALAPFAERRSVRLAVGPALRVLQYEQTLGTCECREPEGGTKAVIGAAADIGVVVPPTGPMHLQLVFAARWFPSHNVPANRGAPVLPLGGWTTYLTIGAGIGL